MLPEVQYVDCHPAVMSFLRTHCIPIQDRGHMHWKTSQARRQAAGVLKEAGFEIGSRVRIATSFDMAYDDLGSKGYPNAQTLRPAP